jgi:hypothetical protein
MTVAREEIFGPVLCILGYRNVEDAIASRSSPSAMKLRAHRRVRLSARSHVSKANKRNLSRVYQGSTQAAEEPESVRYNLPAAATAGEAASSVGMFLAAPVASHFGIWCGLVYDVSHQTPMVGGRVQYALHANPATLCLSSHDASIDCMTAEIS